MAEPLGMTVHDVAAPALADPDAVERGRTRRGRMRMLLVLLVCAAPVIASYFTYFVIRPEGRTNYGELILPTRGLPALALRTLDGAEVPAAALRGQWLLVVVAGARVVGGVVATVSVALPSLLPPPQAASRMTVSERTDVRRRMRVILPSSAGAC